MLVESIGAGSPVVTTIDAYCASTSNSSNIPGSAPAFNYDMCVTCCAQYSNYDVCISGCKAAEWWNIGGIV